MNTLELREKRAKAWDAAKAFLDSKRGEDGLVSAEDTAVYDKMEADVAALGKEIDRLERQAAIENELNKPTAAPIRNAPELSRMDAKIGRASNEYRQDFFAAMRGRPVSNVLQTGVDEDGGYLVPEEFENTIVQGLDEANVVRTLAKTITTASDRKIPVAVDSSVAQWTPENGTIAESQPSFAQKTLTAYKLAVASRVSNELLQDSMFNLEQYLSADFARALGVAEEEAFCVGDGNGQPTGIFHETDGGQIGHTAAKATEISFDDVITLIYGLKSPYRRNAAFLINDATIAGLRKLKDATGLYLWQPSPQQGQPDRLFGYPLYMSPYVPRIAADALVLAFGDFNYYWIADRAGRTMQRLIELYAMTGQVGFLATERVDGKVILPEGIKLLQMGS